MKFLITCLLVIDSVAALPFSLLAGTLQSNNRCRLSFLFPQLQSAMSEVLLESVLVCPVCGFAKLETMPTDACQFFYECSSCKTLLRPKPGDCCVFCSFGSVKCPPLQDENRTCCAAE